NGRLHLSIGWGSEEKGRSETVGYPQAEKQENGMLDAEARRLLYVAATRARDHMIIPVVGPREKAKGMLEWLLPDLPGPHPEGEGAIVATGAGDQLPLGDALHRVMELVDLPGASNLAPLVAAVAHESGLADREAELLELAHACLTSSMVKAAAASGAYWREVP